MERTHIGLDFFDASINRVAAWTIGTRNAIRALLMALLEPRDLLQQYEADGNFTARLALLEELNAGCVLLICGVRAAARKNRNAEQAGS